ncbi:MAG: acyl-CoA dehydrogenase [Gaiellaceae bacterium]|nr:acyl-CoA dehydrogenase [Gaiellaceae bacterium]
MSAQLEGPSLAAGIREAAAIGQKHAGDVDRNSRFPHEAVDALRSCGALAALVPVSLGGPEVPLPDVAAGCFELARACPATGMVFAMHQIQVGCLADVAASEDFFRRYLAAMVTTPALIASVTSEVGVGGDLRRSVAAVERDGDEIRLSKAGPTLSYGAHADAFLITARRAPDAGESDQVVVLVRSPQAEIEPTSEWDSLGMRGTCSPGFRIRAACPAEQASSVPFADIATRTMVPYSHLLWAHVWLGIATDASDRAAAFVRAQARGRPGVVPPTATRLSELSTRLFTLRGVVDSAVGEYGRLRADGGDGLATYGYAVRINNLKIAASEGVLDVCHGALQICGMAGYKNDTPFSVGRHIRDALSASLMIGNDRIHATDASLLLAMKSA